MELLRPDNPKLNLRSRELTKVDFFSNDTKNLIAEMKRISLGQCIDNQTAKRSVVGLSAPQLGYCVRVILIDQKANPNAINLEPDIKILINPKIISASDNESLMREGCWSTGDICGAVLRPDEVTVSAIDENGNKFIFKSSNPFQSHILQHEIDHLDGIRFPSRIRDPKYLHIVAKDEFQDYRENWRTWGKLCPLKEWLVMYKGEKNANV
jgi:peptide deformylase